MLAASVVLKNMLLHFYGLFNSVTSNDFSIYKLQTMSPVKKQQQQIHKNVNK